MNLLNITTTNYTNTDISEEEILDDIPLVEMIENDSESEHAVESTVLKIFSKFFKAIVTLLISGLLLGVTFLLITLWKRGCRTHRKLEEEGKAKNGKCGGTLHSVIVTPPEDDSDLPTFIDYDSTIPTNSKQKQAVPVKGGTYMKVPMGKQTLLRRASGVFGSEALSFVAEQYTMKQMEKEGSHHHHHHGRNSPHSQQHSPHHFHSGHSSTGGGSIHKQQQQSEEIEEPKSSKWNCFKGSNN